MSCPTGSDSAAPLRHHGRHRLSRYRDFPVGAPPRSRINVSPAAQRLRAIRRNPNMADVDVVIIGAGHNGLTCAAYLGMAGLKVRGAERRAVVGGTAVTEEFHPGFRNSVAAYTVSLLQPKVIADLDLHRHGLRIVERRAQNFLPIPDGRYLLTGEGRHAARNRQVQRRDGERYAEFQSRARARSPTCCASWCCTRRRT